MNQRQRPVPADFNHCQAVTVVTERLTKGFVHSIITAKSETGFSFDKLNTRKGPQCS